MAVIVTLYLRQMLAVPQCLPRAGEREEKKKKLCALAKEPAGEKKERRVFQHFFLIVPRIFFAVSWGEIGLACGHELKRRVLQRANNLFTLFSKSLDPKNNESRHV